MNKMDLVHALAVRAQVAEVEAERVLDAFIKIVQEALNQEGDLRIVAFRAFSMAHRKASLDRDVNDSETVNVPAIRAARFLKEID